MDKSLFLPYGSKLEKISLLDSSFIRFLLVGIANTLLGLSVIYTTKWMLQMGNVLANLLGYCCGLVLSFILNSRWSFRYTDRKLPALIKFIVIIVLAYLLNLLVVITAIQVFAINSYIAQALGIIPYTLLTYLGSRFIAFRSSLHATVGQVA